MHIHSKVAGFTTAILWVALLFVVVLAAGCEQPEEIDLLAQGEALCLDQKWDEARGVLKKHLLTHPDDAGAHYYLGRCNVYSAIFWPEVAKGEYETALQLFLSNGKKSPIERFSDEYFEMICHIHTAEVQAKLVDKLLLNGFQVTQLQPFIDSLEVSLDRAREVSPDHPDVQIYDTILRDFRAAAAWESKASASRGQGNAAL